MFIVSNFNQNEKSLRNESLNNVSQMSDRYAHPTKYDDFLKPTAMELLTCIPTTPIEQAIFIYIIDSINEY
jgi:hypothetical protein